MTAFWRIYLLVSVVEYTNTACRLFSPKNPEMSVELKGLGQEGFRQDKKTQIEKLTFLC